MNLLVKKQYRDMYVHVYLSLSLLTYKYTSKIMKRKANTTALFVVFCTDYYRDKRFIYFRH